MSIRPMSIWRRLVATGLLLLALSLLVSIGHGPEAPNEGAVAQAAVDADHGHPCSPGPACSPFVVAPRADGWGPEWPSAPAHLQAFAQPLYLSPHLSADPPPPRRPA